MKKPIIIAISILALVCGGLYYHLNVQAKFEQLEAQTISGQLEDVKKQARELEATLDMDKKFIESTKSRLENKEVQLEGLYHKSNQLKQLLQTG